MAPDRPDGSEQHRCRVLGKPLRGQWTLDIALRLHHLRRHPLGTNQPPSGRRARPTYRAATYWGAVFPLPGNASRGADTSAPLYMNYSTLSGQVQALFWELSVTQLHKTLSSHDFLGEVSDF